MNYYLCVDRSNKALMKERLVCIAENQAMALEIGRHVLKSSNVTVGRFKDKTTVTYRHLANINRRGYLDTLAHDDLNQAIDSLMVCPFIPYRSRKEKINKFL